MRDARKGIPCCAKPDAAHPCEASDMRDVRIEYKKEKSGNGEILRLFKAQTGFEPVRTGVADHCLTTWLLRRTQIIIPCFIICVNHEFIPNIFVKIGRGQA